MSERMCKLKYNGDVPRGALRALQGLARLRCERARAGDVRERMRTYIERSRVAWRM